MITIDEKLYIKKNVNEIVVSYSKHVVLRNLLNQFSFTLNEEQQCVSELIKEVNF